MADLSVAAPVDPVARAVTAIEAVEAVIQAGLLGCSGGNVVDGALFRRVDQLDALRKELKRLTEQVAELVAKGQEVLVDQYAAMGISEIGFDDRFGSLQSQVWARKKDPTVTTQDVVAALAADGLTELITEPSYNAQSLSAFVRGLEEEGKPIPQNLAEVIEAYETWKVSFTTRRPNRARRRLAGAHSAVLDGES
jgi:hypothetical protein